VFRGTPPWEGRSKHFTLEFEAFAVTLMREMPVKRAGQILGESDSRMWRMLLTHVKLAQVRLSFKELVSLGSRRDKPAQAHHSLRVLADLIK
jgi:transposase